jgi:hypothetical protein
MTSWLSLAWAVPDLQRPFLAVPRTAAAPEIDGTLDDDAWESAGCVPFIFQRGSFRPESQPTRTFFTWDDESLYVAFDCAEPYPDRIMYRRTKPDVSGLDDDDCVQLFIQRPGMELYYRFVINTGGHVYDEHHYDLEWDSEFRGAAHVGEKAWTAEMAIPWTALGGPPEPETPWRANLMRHRLTEGDRFSQWSRTDPEVRKPHQFGYLQFVNRAPVIHRLELGTELPGLNRLSAHVVSPAGDAQLRVHHAEGADGTTSFPLPSGEDREVTVDYPITTRSPEKLVIELADENRTYFHQPIDLAVTPLISAAQFDRSMVQLAGKAAATEDETFRAALNRLRDRGQTILAGLDRVVTSAIDAGQTVPREEWEEAAGPVLAFQEMTQQPVLWTQHPLARTRPTTVPGDVNRLEPIQIAAAVNELEAGALLVRNAFADQDVDLRFEMGEVEQVEGNGANPLRRAHIALCEALMIPTRAHGVTADPVSPLGKAGVIHVPLDQTREFWFQVDTAGVSPGLYAVPVHLHPLDYEAGVLISSFELQIRVWDFELPDEMPIAVYNFDYTRALREHPDHRTDQLRCRTTVFQVTGIPNPDDDGHADFSPLNPVLDQLPEDGQAFMEVWFMRSRGWQPRFEPWLRKLVRYMNARGLGYDRWFLHIFDESASEDFEACATEIKRIDPQVRISTTHMAEPERLEAFLPLIDIWIPLFRHLDRPELETMKATGKPVWMYDCGTTPMFATSRHRFLPWRAWRYGLDGVTLWTYSQNNWNDLPHESNFGQFFRAADGGTVPSKRWVAWRDGLEDYLYLVLYEAELGKLGKPTPEDEALLEQARELGAEDPAEVEQYHEVRTAIAERILELRNSK